MPSFIYKMAHIRTSLFAVGALLAARLAIAQTGDAVAACTEIQSLMSSSGIVMSDVGGSIRALLSRSDMSAIVEI